MKILLTNDDGLDAPIRETIEVARASMRAYRVHDALAAAITQHLASVASALPAAVLGAAFTFGLAAAVQATLAATFAHEVLGMDAAGGLGLIILIAIANAVLGVALGLLCSAFARTAAYPFDGRNGEKVMTVKVSRMLARVWTFLVTKVPMSMSLGSWNLASRSYWPEVE